MTTKDVTIILAVRNLGRFLNPSVRSVEAAIAKVRADLSLSTQWILLADNPDSVTEQFLDKHVPSGAELIVTSFGNLAAAKAQALQKAEGTFVALSGGDDLLSSNWLGNAYKESVNRQVATVFHPATIIVFGERRFLSVTADQEHPDFSKDVLFSRNPWPGVSFGPKEVFVEHPFREVEHAKGFGHSDWLWVCDTVANGIVHKPAAGTFSCCHHRQGHSCVTSALDPSLLLPKSKLFQLSVKLGVE